MKKTNDAFNKSGALASTIIEKMNGINKSRKKFFKHLFMLFMGIRGRYNFLNMARYGDYSEQSYRNNFEQPFDFMRFNMELINKSCSRHRILAFDPSYIPKSGKHTDHLGWFWSGTSGKALKGLEIGGLAVVDMDKKTIHIRKASEPTNYVKEIYEACGCKATIKEKRKYVVYH